MYSQWLTYEETFIKMQYNRLSNEVIAKALSRDIIEIKNKAIEFGLEKPEEPKEPTIPEQMQIDLSSLKVNTVKNSKEKRFVADGILIYMPEHPNCTAEGYIFEQRLVMEKQLGRYLKPHELVFRKDGDKFNNSLDNLYIKLTSRIDDIDKEYKRVEKKKYINPYNQTMFDIFKKSGYNFEKNYRVTVQNNFLNKSYVYLKNKGYSNDFIKKTLKITQNHLWNLRKRNLQYVYYKPLTKTDIYTIFDFKRIKRKHGVPYKTIFRRYNLGGTERKQIMNNSIVE